MPEWLHDTFRHDDTIPARLLVIYLAVSLALGCVVAGIYRVARGEGNGTAVGFTATLVLLTVLITIVTLVIGSSVARAFSLVGALSIVRFRTVVEDTRDTAFVIFAVSVGMAVGAGFLTVPLIGIPFAAAAAFLFRPRAAAARSGSATATLLVRVGLGHDPERILNEVFTRHLAQVQLLSAVTARQGAALDLTYAIQLPGNDNGLSLLAELTKRDGVQSIDLRRGPTSP